VPDVEHENTLKHVPAHLRKRNYKWVKVKSYKGRRSRKARSAQA